MALGNFFEPGILIAGAASAGAATPAYTATSGSGPHLMATGMRLGSPVTAADPSFLALRELLGGFIFHVLNRRKTRRQIFERDEAYEALERVIVETAERIAIRRKVRPD